MGVIDNMEPIMKKRDARCLERKTQEQLRFEIVRRRLAGESRKSIARSVQYSETRISTIMARYKNGGMAALASRKAPGAVPKLTVRQHERLRDMIVSKTPRQLKFAYALWTIPLVQELILRKFGVVLHETSVGRMLRRMGLTPQVPIRQAFARDEEACRQWATKTFPAIVRKVRRKQGVLLFADETGVHEDGPVGRTWAERGKTPVVRTTGGRQKVNVISAISPRGRLWFRCYTGNLNAPMFIAFLGELLHDVRGEIFLIQDRHPAHVAAKTKRFIHDHKDRLHVHDLPGYAPDMNPDEHVWSHLKGMFRYNPLKEDDDLAFAVQSNMKRIAARKALVRAFFDHPAVAYVKEALAW